MKTSGLSGNEIYCLDKNNYKAGDIVIGNSVHSLGFLKTISSGFRAIAGGEIQEYTKLIEEGRETALQRMQDEATQKGAKGITGVTNEIVFHGTNIEFLSVGSTVHTKGIPPETKENLEFSTSSDGQDLYVQEDCGYIPKKFVFGNVAYSIGLASGIIGSLKTLARGEIKEFSQVFNTTRHLALQRIIDEAKQAGANSVVGIETSILAIGNGLQEMLMIGTASTNPLLSNDVVITSDLTPQEMWNLNKMGYLPIKMLLGTSVYSLGFIGGVTSFLKSFTKGEIPELSRLIYEARENALKIINDEANALGADEVVGVKTYVYQLGNGLIEMIAIGTAMKKVPNLKNKSEELIPQAFSPDWDTFVNTADTQFGVNLNQGA